MPPILVDGKMTAGEKRMLEWPGLTALHTLFLRSQLSHSHALVAVAMYL
jgi:hypothetical protein